MKLRKRLLGFALACIMAMGLSTTTFAAEQKEQTQNVETSNAVSPRAGTETWYPGDVKFGEMNLTNNNLTPTKTMGATGTLYVYGYFRSTDGGPRAALTTQIRRNNSAQVLTSKYAIESSQTGQRTFFATSYIHVNAGDKIQIFTDISSYTPQPAGSPYRKAFVELYYHFDAD